jgi:hypothetical protein
MIAATAADVFGAAGAALPTLGMMQADTIGMPSAV